VKSGVSRPPPKLFNKGVMMRKISIWNGKTMVKAHTEERESISSTVALAVLLVFLFLLVGFIG
jgi:hypothetical protein